MKAKTRKKLQLSRETLKTLNSDQLRGVGGGLACRTGTAGSSDPNVCDGEDTFGCTFSCP